MENTNNYSDTLIEFTSGHTIGGEPAFVFPDVLKAVAVCGTLEVAVLGVELFISRAQGYETKAVSSYEFRVKEWQRFVDENNCSAEVFIQTHRGGDDHFYLLTTSSEAELFSLIQV